MNIWGGGDNERRLNEKYMRGKLGGGGGGYGFFRQKYGSLIKYNCKQSFVFFPL
jgi:hypothetical protein